MNAKERKELVIEKIKEGKNFSEVKKELKEEGIDYKGLNSSFYRWRKEVLGEEDVKEGEERLEGEGDVIEAGIQKLEEKTKKASAEKKRRKWSDKQQKDADNSYLARLINTGVFYFTPCPNKNLKREEVEAINIGGAVVGVLNYYFPSMNLKHPLIVLGSRAVLLMITIKERCYKAVKKIKQRFGVNPEEEIAKDEASGVEGIKPQYRELYVKQKMPVSRKERRKQKIKEKIEQQNQKERQVK